jgi:hypothetical protein
MKLPAIASCCLLAAAAPVSAQVVRVSVSTAGVQGNAASEWPSISGDGRYVVFTSAATNLVAGDTNGHADVFLRDRDTDADGVFDESGAVATTRLSVGPGNVQADAPSQNGAAISHDGRYVVFSTSATTLGFANPSGQPQVYRLDRATNALALISVTTGGTAGDTASTSPLVSDDGNVVAFQADGDSHIVASTPGVHVYVRNVTQGTTVVAPEVADFAPLPRSRRDIGVMTLSGDGSRVAYVATERPVNPMVTPTATYGVVADLSSGVATRLSPTADARFVALSRSGRAVVTSNPYTTQRRFLQTGAITPDVFGLLPGVVDVAAASPSARYAVSHNGGLWDYDEGTGARYATGAFSAVLDFSADDRWLAIDSVAATLVPGDTNGVTDVFVIDLPDQFDADNDGMRDSWESFFGITDPNADPDGDGLTNVQEAAAGTNPVGTVRRYLAEGATGTFFHTRIAIAAPRLSPPTRAVVTFDRGDGTRAQRLVRIEDNFSRVVDPGSMLGFEFADVSTTVEADGVVAVERTMTWADVFGRTYGSHAETASAAPSTTWFLAEGSTVLGFDLFYLLQNPQATTTRATVRFLLPSGATVSRTYALAPRSRSTIYVNQVPGLDETDVSGDIVADAPIVVERSMYRSTPGQPFALGTDSAGVTAASTSWFFAEGATGTFFDLYLLMANPGSSDATVQASYARPDGSVVTQHYLVRAHSRHSVYVDSIPGLEATSVATTLSSSAPIVAERAMYWPGGFFDYYEGHTSVGSVTVSRNWVIAGGEGGTEDRAQTFVLIANTENRAGQATLTVMRELGVVYPPTVSDIVVALPANSRTTVPIYVEGRFAIHVGSTGAAPVDLVVESAVYRGGDGVLWSGGSNTLATPVP